MNWRAGERPLVSNPLSDDPWPVAAKNLLTEREQSLYLSLLSLYPDHKLFVQVALSQLIDVPEDHSERQSIRNRFSQLVADFVLCRADLSVVAVIELDDRSHLRADRRAADARKNKALTDAGIRLVRIPAGRLPSEDFLLALIDHDEKARHGPQETPELSLVEDTYSPERDESADDSSAVSGELKRVAIKALVVGIVVVGGWYFFSQLMPILIRQAFQPLATQPPRSAVASKTSVLVPRVVAPLPVISQPNADDVSGAKRGQEETSLLQKQKSLAWAAFYSPPASCEHPIDWRTQVECGNQYMRAKKAFQEKWAAEHPSQGSGAEVVLDNSSVGGPHK